eukprot:c23990_g9_i2 orf=69-374(-)
MVPEDIFKLLSSEFFSPYTKSSQLHTTIVLRFIPSAQLLCVSSLAPMYFLFHPLQVFQRTFMSYTWTVIMAKHIAFSSSPLMHTSRRTSNLVCLLPPAAPG